MCEHAQVCVGMNECARPCKACVTMQDRGSPDDCTCDHTRMCPPLPCPAACGRGSRRVPTCASFWGLHGLHRQHPPGCIPAPPQQLHPHPRPGVCHPHPRQHPAPQGPVGCGMVGPRGERDRAVTLNLCHVLRGNHLRGIPACPGASFTRHGAARCCMALYSIARFHTAFRSVARYRTPLHGIVRHCTLSHSFPQHCTLSHTIARCCTALHNVAQLRLALCFLARLCTGFTWHFIALHALARHHPASANLSLCPPSQRKLRHGEGGGGHTPRGGGCCCGARAEQSGH